MFGMCQRAVARSITASMRRAFWFIVTAAARPAWTVGGLSKARGASLQRGPRGRLLRGRLDTGARGGDPLGDAVGQGVAPRERAGLDDLAGQRAADDFLDALGHGHELVEVDPGGDAHRVEAVDQVLAADVAGGARRERAAAETADRAVEVRDAALERGQDVRDRQRARVVGVQGPFDTRKPRQQVLEHAADLPRVGHAGRVGEADRARADVHEPADDALELTERHLAFERAAEGGRDAAADLDLRALDDAHDRGELLDGLGARHVDVRQVVALARGDDRVDRVHAGVHRADGALLVRHQRGVARAGPPADRRHDALGVAQLWDGLRVDERGHLDARQARG